MFRVCFWRLAASTAVVSKSRSRQARVSTNRKEDDTGPHTVVGVNVRSPLDAPDVKELLRDLKLCKGLTRLDVARCGLDSSSVATLLNHCEGLTYLDVSRTRKWLSGERLTKALTGVLKRSPALTYLNVASNVGLYSGSDTAKALAEGLQHCPALTHLDVSANNLSFNDVEMIGNSLQRCTGLTHLNLSDNALGKEIEGLSCILQHWPALSSLNMRGNYLDWKSIGILAATLRQCQELTHLDLSRNTYSDWSGHETRCDEKTKTNAYASALQHCTKLQYFNVSDNRLHLNEAKALAAALPQCQGLTHLDVSKNRVGSELFAALPRCPALTRLDVSKNAIGSEGGTALAAVLPQCPSLVWLDVGYNNIGVRGVKALEEAGRCCKTLRSLLTDPQKYRK